MKDGKIVRMNVTRSAVSRAVMSVLECRDLRRATVYLDAKTTVKCTRRCRLYGRDHAQTVIVTVGRPNYAERKFTNLCKKAGEPFPVKKIQLKWWPKKARK